MNHCKQFESCQVITVTSRTAFNLFKFPSFLFTIKRRLSVGFDYIQSNGPTNRDFPSARQNVTCRERGRLSVRNLTGDGQSHQFTGSGFSAEACRTFGATTTMSVASLDPSRSTITRDRTTRDDKIGLVGGGFMPCGKTVQVKVSSDDGNSERSDSLVVDASSVLSCTETEIVFVITQVHVDNFSEKSEWKVRTLNGDTFYMYPWVVLRKKPSIMHCAAADQEMSHESAIEQAVTCQIGVTSRPDSFTKTHTLNDIANLYFGTQALRNEDVSSCKDLRINV
ncbi:hypothetical protein BLNAU_8223 [Blattamonas nauphoetae]|uniref:Uncharacterized protein n=1 Tax=Blattamonas nauphoetae TaxID=2049346 RepID=A0ABQ9XZ70_9EUKA|nr:hypothetical protein BLNAU_8223 [Blattamonas nauphoetae]